MNVALFCATGVAVGHKLGGGSPEPEKESEKIEWWLVAGCAAIVIGMFLLGVIVGATQF